MNSRQPYRPQSPQIPADPLCGNPCDSRDPRRCVPPLKGLRKLRAASVSYRASVPAGHGDCGVSPSYRALSPYGENQKSSFKALPDNESIPTTPPPFRHTPNHSWPQPTTTVWRNLQQNLQHLRIHYSSFTIHHSSFCILHCLSPSPPRNATLKPAYLTLVHGITAAI